MKTEEKGKLLDIDKIKEIPKWTHKYVQNRMQTNLILLIINIILLAGIAAPFYLYGLFISKNGNIVFKVICIIASLVSFLIVAGVPIVFTKESGLVSLNILIPTFEYGFLTFVIIYIYSRYALGKLKGITYLEGNAADGD